MNNTPKLIQYLEEHGITVMSFDDKEIVVNSLYSSNGEPLWIEETVPATLKDVRDYLGY